ncbi:hypothetical protein WHR41_03389 [Cladosporium halotolerans]|uniref:Uncharacterized protein n=1 Tax=Cladosporium halotolerans TaxID=1052096 RepID=A0AB34KX54_9PEZI
MASASNGTHLNGTNGHHDNDHPGLHYANDIGENDGGNAREYYGDNAADPNGDTNGDDTLEYYGTDPPDTNGVTNGDNLTDAVGRNGGRDSEVGEGPISPRSAGIESTHDSFEVPFPSPGRPIIASPMYLMRPPPAEIVNARLNELIARANRNTSATAGTTTAAGSSAQADVAGRRLRRIQELMFQVNEITVERDRNSEMLRRRQLHIDNLERQIDSLQGQNRTQRLEYMESVSRLNLERAALIRQVEQRTVDDTETRVKDYQEGVNDGMRAQGPPTERTVLIQQVEASRQEAERWRMAAMRAGGEAISTVWQGSVDEAVRRERERDAVIFTSWRTEINSLREARDNAEARAERAEQALRARQDEEAQKDEGAEDTEETDHAAGAS